MEKVMWRTDNSFGPGKDYGSLKELFDMVMEHLKCRTRRCCSECKRKIDSEELERSKEQTKNKSAKRMRV